MSFLAPLFLLGTLAVALPVLFHLVRRTTRQRRVFGSLMFLRPAPPRLTRRNRLENLLLLMLRCAVVVLLALAFARPFLMRGGMAEAGSGTGQRVVVVVDLSASMQRGNLWSQAVDRAVAALRELRPGDEAALLTYDRRVTTLLDFNAWNAIEAGARVAVARDRLTSVRPGWGATHLDRALIGAVELSGGGATADSRPARIVLVTDLQEGSRLVELQAQEWPRNVTVTVETLEAKGRTNAGLQLAGEPATGAPGMTDGVRLRVVNAVESGREQFEVGWAAPTGDGFLGTPLDVHVPAGQSRVVTLRRPEGGGPFETVRLRGDDEPFDNTVFAVPPPVARHTVVHLGDDAARDTRRPLFYLERAFPGTTRQVVAVRSVAGETLPADLELERAALLVAGDGMTAGMMRRVREVVAAGRTLLLVPTTVEAARGLWAGFGVGQAAGLEIEEAVGSRPALLGEIDFGHPVFAPFADPRFSDFTRIHFWRHRRVEGAGLEAMRVLARFDDGDPALLEWPLESGRVLWLTSGWHPTDSQLALSTKFVPWLHGLLEYGGARPAAAVQHRVGDRVPLDGMLTTGTGDFEVTRPDGRVVVLAAGTIEFAETDLPGIYPVRRGATTGRFAVNLDPLESRTDPLLPEELEALGVPGVWDAGRAELAVNRERRLERVEIEGRQKLWRWLLLATLMGVVVETWLGGRTTRRPAEPAEVGP